MYARATAAAAAADSIAECVCVAAIVLPAALDGSLVYASVTAKGPCMQPVPYIALLEFWAHGWVSLPAGGQPGRVRLHEVSCEAGAQAGVGSEPEASDSMMY